MKKYKLLLAGTIIISLYTSEFSQTNNYMKEMQGKWKGTSICVKMEGNENCHNEIIIYNFHAAVNDSNKLTQDAFKLVKNDIVPMDTLDFNFDSKSKMWVSEFKNSRVHILWSFYIQNNKLIGTCSDFVSKKIYRNVVAIKQ